MNGSTASDSCQTSVLGLTQTRLQPVVDDVAGEPVATFEVHVVDHAWPHYGVRGEKVAASFAWTTRSGRAGETMVFVKKQGEPICDRAGREIAPAPAEAMHYRSLALHHAPVPRMYGALTVAAPDPREVIFLEWLDEVVTEQEPFGRFQNDAEHFRQFLSSVARFNAIVPSSEYAEHLGSVRERERHYPWHREGHGRADSMFAEVKSMYDDAQQGKLGSALQRTCSRSAHQLSALETLAHRLVKQRAAMATGFCHRDLEPFQTGRRRSTGEVVLFDIESPNLAPRFCDVAVCLGAPDAYQPRCRPREELAQHYLDEYARHGGPPVPLGRFLDETYTLWLEWTYGWLSMFHRQALDGKPKGRDLLQRKLTFLLCAASHGAKLVT